MLSPLAATCVCVGGLLAALEPAIPADAPDFEQTTWGEFIDPDGDCAADFDGAAVTLDLPATRHDLSVETDSVNAPRILRDIDGDFIAEVRVDGEIQPTGPSTIPGRKPYQSAGLLLWLDDETYVRLERAAMIQPDTGGIQFFVNLELRRDGAMAGAMGALTADEPLYLRLERKAGRVFGSFSRDRLNWQGFKPLPADLAGPARIGVLAISSGSNPLRVEFEGFSIYKRERLGEP